MPIVLLAILGPFAFVLPVGGGQHGLAMTILLSMSVMMTILSDSIPPISTQTCQLSKYNRHTGMWLIDLEHAGYCFTYAFLPSLNIRNTA